MTGDFGMPHFIAIRNDRIYLTEVPSENRELSEDIRTWANRRLLVLELNGEIHQEIHLPGGEDVCASRLCFRSDGQGGEELLVVDDAPVDGTDRHCLHVLRML